MLKISSYKGFRDSYNETNFSPLKGTVSRDFRPLLRHGSNMHTNRQKQFRELFRFRDDIQLQCLKIACLRSCSIFNYCYWVGVHNQIPFFYLINLLKSVRSLQSFSKSVRVVNNYADTVSVQSTTTLTLCPRGQRLR